jgi:hypothetical protein
MAQVELSRNTQKRIVPWVRWGPNGSYMLLRSPSEIWVCYVYGMKFIQLLPWKKGNSARVYDFNKYAARRDVRNEQTTEPKLLWRRLGMPQSLNSRCSAFDEEVNTYLPGRVATVEVMPSDTSHDWEAAMIGEDNIVLVSVSLPTRPVWLSLIRKVLLSLMQGSMGISPCKLKTCYSEAYVAFANLCHEIS